MCSSRHATSSRLPIMWLLRLRRRQWRQRLRSQWLRLLHMRRLPLPAYYYQAQFVSALRGERLIGLGMPKACLGLGFSVKHSFRGISKNSSVSVSVSRFRFPLGYRNRGLGFEISIGTGIGIEIERNTRALRIREMEWKSFHRNFGPTSGYRNFHRIRNPTVNLPRFRSCSEVLASGPSSEVLLRILERK